MRLSEFGAIGEIIQRIRDAELTEINLFLIETYSAKKIILNEDPFLENFKARVNPLNLNGHAAKVELKNFQDVLYTALMRIQSIYNITNQKKGHDLQFTTFLSDLMAIVKHAFNYVTEKITCRPQVLLLSKTIHDGTVSFTSSYGRLPLFFDSALSNEAQKKTIEPIPESNSLSTKKKMSHPQADPPARPSKLLTLSTDAISSVMEADQKIQELNQHGSEREHMHRSV